MKKVKASKVYAKCSMFSCMNQAEWSMGTWQLCDECAKLWITETGRGWGQSVFGTSRRIGQKAILAHNLQFNLIHNLVAIQMTFDQALKRLAEKEPEKFRYIPGGANEQSLFICKNDDNYVEMYEGEESQDSIDAVLAEIVKRDIVVDFVKRKELYDGKSGRNCNPNRRAQ